MISSTINQWINLADSLHSSLCPWVACECQSSEVVCDWSHKWSRKFMDNDWSSRQQSRPEWSRDYPNIWHFKPTEWWISWHSSAIDWPHSQWRTLFVHLCIRIIRSAPDQRIDFDVICPRLLSLWLRQYLFIKMKFHGDCQIKVQLISYRWSGEAQTGTSRRSCIRKGNEHLWRLFATDEFTQQAGTRREKHMTDRNRSGCQNKSFVPNFRSLHISFNGFSSQYVSGRSHLDI
jgi:hypothetical protein